MPGKKIIHVYQKSYYGQYFLEILTWFVLYLNIFGNIIKINTSQEYDKVNK